MAQLLSNLPVGTKVKFGKHRVGTETPWSIVWRIVAKSHTGYPTNSVTLLSERSIDNLAFDAIEPGNTIMDRKNAGNNRYSLSNIDQWLNTSAQTWFTASHSYDIAPTKDHVQPTGANQAYDTRPGFLSSFSSNERSAILDTTVRVYLPYVDGSGYEDIVRKVFLPSYTELSGSPENTAYEGTRWEWFKNNPTYTCALEQSVYDKSSAGLKPNASTDPWSWRLRTATWGSSGSNTRYIDKNGSYVTQVAAYTLGIRPAVNVSNTLKVSDTMDADGCYAVVWNSAPYAPTSINIPSTIYGGKSNSISWSTALDPDGDTVTYALECSVNGGAYSQIYSGSSLTYTHLVTFGTSTITYRVKAVDPSGESSTYITSATRNVVNNNAPVISGSDSNLGTKSAGFSGTYTVTDANSNSVTVTESIDGVQIRAFVATLGATNTYGITGNTWLTLANGSHTLTIRATDGIDTSVRTYTFTKLVNGFTIQNTTPWAASTMPSRIMLVITRNIPTTSTFKVEVCNNGYDSSPKWEDATEAVKSRLVHVFSNTSKTTTNWGILVRVTVNRNGATGACYISAIGGNFE